MAFDPSSRATLSSRSSPGTSKLHRGKVTLEDPYSHEEFQSPFGFRRAPLGVSNRMAVSVGLAALVGLMATVSLVALCRLTSNREKREGLITRRLSSELSGVNLCMEVELATGSSKVQQLPSSAEEHTGIRENIERTQNTEALSASEASPDTPSSLSNKRRSSFQAVNENSPQSRAESSGKDPLSPSSSAKVPDEFLSDFRSPSAWHLQDVLLQHPFILGLGHTANSYNEPRKSPYSFQADRFQSDRDSNLGNASSTERVVISDDEPPDGFQVHSSAGSNESATRHYHQRHHPRSSQDSFSKEDNDTRNSSTRKRLRSGSSSSDEHPAFSQATEASVSGTPLSPHHRQQHYIQGHFGGSSSQLPFNTKDSHLSTTGPDDTPALQQLAHSPMSSFSALPGHPQEASHDPRRISATVRQRLAAPGATDATDSDSSDESRDKQRALPYRAHSLIATVAPSRRTQYRHLFEGSIPWHSPPTAAETSTTASSKLQRTFPYTLSYPARSFRLERFSRGHAAGIARASQTREEGSTNSGEQFSMVGPFDQGQAPTGQVAPIWHIRPRHDLQHGSMHLPQRHVAGEILDPREKPLKEGEPLIGVGPVGMISTPNMSFVQPDWYKRVGNPAKRMLIREVDAPGASSAITSHNQQQPFPFQQLQSILLQQIRSRHSPQLVVPAGAPHPGQQQQAQSEATESSASANAAFRTLSPNTLRREILVSSTLPEVEKKGSAANTADTGISSSPPYRQSRNTSTGANPGLLAGVPGLQASGLQQIHNSPSQAGLAEEQAPAQRKESLTALSLQQPANAQQVGPSAEVSWPGQRSEQPANAQQVGPSAAASWPGQRSERQLAFYSTLPNRWSTGGNFVSDASSASTFTGAQHAIPVGISRVKYRPSGFEQQPNLRQNPTKPASALPVLENVGVWIAELARNASHQQTPGQIPQNTPLPVAVQSFPMPVAVDPREVPSSVSLDEFTNNSWQAQFTQQRPGARQFRPEVLNMRNPEAKTSAATIEWMRYYLFQPRLNDWQKSSIVSWSEELVVFANTFMSKPIWWGFPNAAVWLGCLYFIFDTLKTACERIGPDMKAELWWDEFARQIPTKLLPPPWYASRQLNEEEYIALKLSEAIESIKFGGTVSKRQIRSLLAHLDNIGASRFPQVLGYHQQGGTL